MNQDLLSSKAWVNLGVFTTLLLGGVWWTQSPLTSSRPRDPQTTKLIDASFPSDKPYARPWQDPFEPYFDQANLSGGGKATTDSKQVDKSLRKRFKEDFAKQFRGDKPDNREPLLLVGIMVPGGPFEDRTERRQRIRVALASAMAAGGYEPVDSEHLGSFPLNISDDNRNDREKSLKNPWDDCKIPYEWFKALPKDERRWASPPSVYRNILVFWISDDRFAGQPLNCLRRLREEVEDAIKSEPEDAKDENESFHFLSFGNKSFNVQVLIEWLFASNEPPPQPAPEGEDTLQNKLKNAKFRIFGPWSSTTLKKLLEEAEDIKKDGNETGFKNSKLVFYNVFSTAPAHLLFATAEGNNLDTHESALTMVRERLASTLGGGEKHVFHYTTCPDSNLATAMKGELKRRGIDTQNDVIALIAENDTIYGRSLPKTFRREFLGDQPYLKNIKRFTYLRGLDGRVPQEGAKSDSATVQKNNSYGVNSRTSIESRFTPTRKTNRPEGNNQFDYIIRLGDDMRQMERCNGKRFKAIGILGSDVYDKLLLLQTLKPLFPNAVFFTTDLDASYSHPQELEWTKNLLVASTHGFTLNEKYQCGVAPFRFSYQTALFQSVLGATTGNWKDKGNANNNVFEKRAENDPLLTTSPPRLFEIGWYQPYDISVNTVQTIHPERPRMNPAFKKWYFSQFSLLFVLFVIALFVLNWHRKMFRLLGKFLDFVRWFFRLPKKKTKSDPIRFWLIVAGHFVLRLVILAILTIAGIGIFLFVRDIWSVEGEPWLWGSGVSAWPSTLLRLSALITSSILFLVAMNRAQSMAYDLSDRFRLKIGSDDEKKPSIFSFIEYCRQHPDGIIGSARFRLGCMFNKLFFPDKTKTQGKKNIRLSKLWNRWIQDIPAYIVLDSVIGLILFGAVLFLLAMEGNGTLAFRSGISYWVGTIIWGLAWWATITLVLTTFLITRSCYSFIKEMMQGTVQWVQDDPDGVASNFGKRWKVDGRDISNLIDVYFIEAWTSKISNLVLYPIASIVFLFVAESAYFDNYGYNPYRYVVLLLVGLLIFAPAFQLRSAARRLRKQKIERAKVHLNYHHENRWDTDYRKKIEDAIKETENLKEGAFEPFLEHPFMQAILFLLGGISLPAFLGMLSRPF